jgi:hypothetical protein
VQYYIEYLGKDMQNSWYTANTIIIKIKPLSYMYMKKLWSYKLYEKKGV